MNTTEQFAMRCKLATDCLPDARYRVHLERLHKDMLDALAAQPAEPVVEFEDPRVQIVYSILCADEKPPAGEHWEGFAARRIVDALAAQQAELVAFSQFLSDVLTAAGLVEHGKQCKALGNRLSEKVMLYRASAPPPAQQPLTDKQVRALFRENLYVDEHDGFSLAGAMRVVRQVEAAHGIGEKP